MMHGGRAMRGLRTKPRFSGAAACALLAAALTVSGCASTRPPPAPMAAAVSHCAEVRFPIYFQPGSDQMTREQMQVINEAAQRVRGCTLGPLDVVGLAGLEGTREQSMELARRRSLVVAGALKSAGLPAPRFDLDAVGAAGAQSKSGKREPLRRRAEVIIRAGSGPATPAS